MNEFKSVYNLTPEAPAKLLENPASFPELNAIWLKLVDWDDYRGECSEPFYGIAAPTGDDCSFDTAEDYVVDYEGVLVMLPAKPVEEYSSPQELIDEYRKRILDSGLGEIDDFFSDEESLTDAYIAGHILDVFGFDATVHYRAKFKTLRPLLRNCQTVLVFDKNSPKLLVAANKEFGPSGVSISGPAPAEIEKVEFKDGESASDVIPDFYDERYVTKIGIIPRPIRASEILSGLEYASQSDLEGEDVSSNLRLDGEIFIGIDDDDPEDGVVSLIDSATVGSLLALYHNDEAINYDEEISSGELLIYGPDDSELDIGRDINEFADREVDYIEALSPSLREITERFVNGDLKLDKDGMMTVPYISAFTLK